jgi:hypothetical protein
MSGIKGWPSQKKITYAQDTFNEYNTVQPIGSDKNAADVVAKSAFRFSAIDAVEAGSTENIVIATAHGAIPGDFIRFETGTFTNWEIAIVKVTANEMYLGTKLSAAPGVGDTFYIMKYITPRVDATGAIVATPGPSQFVYDGVDTQVEEDTVDPTNNRAMPVTQLGEGYLGSTRLDYSVTNVTTGAWVQLIADTGAKATKGITLFDGGGYAMELGIGAAASEARTLLIPPGGFNGVIHLGIPANSRLSIRAIGAATVDAGEIDINLLG